MYTSVQDDFSTTCYERPPVLSDRFCWAEGVVAQDRFYCIRFFNEMENTNESTNLRKLADVWMSKNRCCQGNRNRSALGVTRITVHIVGHPNQVNSHRFRSPKLPQNVRFHQTPRSKTIEVEFQIRVGRSLLPCSR